MGDFLHLAAHDEVGQADATEEFMDLLAQIAPQVVSQAGIAGVAIPRPWQRVASTDSLTASMTWATWMVSMPRDSW